MYMHKYIYICTKSVGNKSINIYSSRGYKLQYARLKVYEPSWTLQSASSLQELSALEPSHGEDHMFGDIFSFQVLLEYCGLHL